MSAIFLLAWEVPRFMLCQLIYCCAYSLGVAADVFLRNLTSYYMQEVILVLFFHCFYSGFIFRLIAVIWPILHFLTLLRLQICFIPFSQSLILKPCQAYLRLY